MTVRVVILNWNGRSWLDPCLDALSCQTLAPAEIVLVDNGSSDGSVEAVRATWPQVEIRALTENRGFAAGNNAGAAGADAKYLAFLNNDTRVDPGWLAALVAPVEQDAGVGLTTSRIVYLDRPGVIDSAGDGYLRCGGGFKHLHGQPADQALESREVFGACGAAFLIRRHLFEALGGFDEDFFMVYEDVDLSYRARLRGARVHYAAGAIVEHAGSASLGRVSESAVFHGQRNLEWTWFKNSPATILWRSLPAHLLYDLAGLAGYAREGRLGVWWRAKLAALRALPAMAVKRREIQQHTSVDAAQLWNLMERDWIGTKRREKGFDFR